MKFHKPSLKLAAVYLAILMLISVFFSVVIYQISANEFNRGFRGQGGYGNRSRVEDRLPTDLQQALAAERTERLTEAKSRVLSTLIVTNFIVLVTGGLLSYYFAARTLRPIEEANEALEQFTADASHELKTPITAMLAENEVALMNPRLTLDQAKAQLESNDEELKRLSQLTAGLLQLANLQNGPLEKTEIDIARVVEQATQRVVPLAERKHILIHTDISNTGFVQGSGSNIIQALVILLENAVKYSPDKTEINVKAETAHKHACISVEDQGKGIKQKDLKHIFDRFYRADTARSKQNVEGYGLGLSIARTIAELHNGTLTATSETGKGSRFELCLPVITRNKQ